MTESELKYISHPITTRIIEHQMVYEHAGLSVPPYRITCKEHKELISSIDPQGKDMIAYYCGVPLEIVMIVDPYC